MDEQKEKKLEWLSQIEQYAKEKNLSARILDSIEECKNNITAEDADWKAINNEVEELLDCIEQKTVPAVLKEENNENEISVQAVEAQMKNMAQRCQTENEESIRSIEVRKSLILKNLYRMLGEITHTKAHLGELKNEDLYLQFFYRQKTVYETNALGMIKELSEAISKNYGYLLEHLRSMFQSIGGYKVGIGNKRFYDEFQERKLGLDMKLQGEIETSEVGGSDIIAFGQRTKEPIKKIVSKLEKRRKFLAWLPLIILLSGFMVNAVVNQEKHQEIIENAAAEEQLQEDGNPQQDTLLDYGKDLVQNVSEDGTALSLVKSLFKPLATVVLALFIILGIYLILILLVIIILYIAYLKFLKAWCNNQICSQCGAYLQTEINRFEQSNNLATQIADVIKTMEEEYEQQYLRILNNLFSGTMFDSESVERKEAERFSAFREEWNRLKFE